jgi:hypothetical protein
MIATFIKKKMKIHITKDETFSNQLFQLIAEFLTPFFKKTLIQVKFHNHMNEGDLTDSQFELNVEADYKKYLFANQIVESGDLTFLQSFQREFDYCRKFRKEKRIKQMDFVVMLTEQQNEANWFGFIDKDMKNVFVCESNWTGYFRYNVTSYLPLSHEIISWVMRSVLFNNQDELIQNIHQEDRGCLMDLNRSKKQISSKMKSLEICMDCQDYMNNTNSIFISILSGILNQINFRLKYLNIKLATSEPSRMVLKGIGQKIHLTDYQNIKINLEHIKTAVYILFLRHEEGIQLSEAFTVNDDRTLHPIHKELVSIYCHLTGGNPEDFNDSKVVTIRSRDAEEISRDISVIKSIFQSLLGEQLANHYIIEKNHESNRHFLYFDRGLVRYIN